MASGDVLSPSMSFSGRLRQYWSQLVQSAKSVQLCMRSLIDLLWSESDLSVPKF